MSAVEQINKKLAAVIKKPAADQDTEIYDPKDVDQSMNKKPAAAFVQQDPALQCEKMFRMQNMDDCEFKQAIENSMYLKHVNLAEEEQKKNKDGSRPTSQILYEASRAKWKDFEDEKNKEIKKKPAATVDQEPTGWINYEGCPIDRRLDVGDLTT
jgi:hypothetical protein